MPAAASTGLATIVITKFAPTLFSADSGFAAAYVVQVAPDGAQTIIPTFMVPSRSLVPSPINLAKPGQTFLILFGTGFDAGDVGSSGARVQEIGVPITYVGPQQAYEGLD